VCEPEEVKGLDRDTITLLDMLAPHIQSALCTRQTLTALGNEEVKGIDDLLEQFPAHVRIDTVGSRVEPSEQALSLLHRSAAKIREIGDECISRMLLAAARRFDSFPITARTQPLLPGCEIGFLDGSVRTGPETPVRTPPIGGASMSAHVTKSLVGFLHRQTNGVPASLLGGDEPIFPAEALLTPRQREVARLAMRGKTVAQIADITNIHFETVRTHLRNIYRRLGINRRSELAAMFRDKLC
jgi:DNA-binding CsgD family transcriptional regulator